MGKRKRIAILFGGCSPEYGVSLQSAASVLEHIDQVKYETMKIGISRGGDWYLYEGTLQDIQEDQWLNKAYCTPIAFLPNRGRASLLLLRDDGLCELSVDAVFPILHGANGEDGTVQGMFELAGIPIVGCGVLSSALCMDKVRAHRLVKAAGIRTPCSLVYEKPYLEADILDEAAALGYPLFVKPVRAGSSLGITRVAQSRELIPAMERAFMFDNTVVLEEAISGIEVGCAVLGNDVLTTGEVDEIELTEGFFDFEEKYTLKSSAIHVPARIPPDDRSRIKDTAMRIYRELDCRGLARVDLFYTPDKEIVFNEVNTLPGFTSHSRYPSMMRTAGWDMSELITKIIELALSTHRKG